MTTVGTSEAGWDQSVPSYGSAISFHDVTTDSRVNPHIDLSNEYDIDGWQWIWKGAMSIMNWTDAYRAWPWDDFPAGLYGAVGAVATIAAGVRADLDGGSSLPADSSPDLVNADRALRILRQVDTLDLGRILNWAQRLNLDEVRSEWLRRELYSARAAGRLRQAVNWLVYDVYQAPTAHELTVRLGAVPVR